MSVIAVKPIPPKWSLMNCVKVLAKAINGNFEALNFQIKMRVKICYLRLSEKLDPVRVVEKINSTQFPKIRPFAYIPDHVPDLPLAAKPKKLPFKMRVSMRLPEELKPDKVLTVTNNEILTELQFKYPGLYNISRKTKHKLLEDLARKIFERLKTIQDAGTKGSDSCFNLSHCYRRVHPHFGDFQLVLSTLHAVEDAAGTPRTQLQEKELATVPPNPYMIENLPFNKVQAACNKYTDRILKKMTDHVKGLNSEVTQLDTQDEVVRKKVREELKKMTPFLPMIVRQVITYHFNPKPCTHVKVRIYGEPFLPARDTMSPFLARYKPGRVVRSERMFNSIWFSVPPSHYAQLMAMDGTVLNGAKLIIRSADLPRYNVSELALAGIDNGELHTPDDEDMDVKAEEWKDMM